MNSIAILQDERYLAHLTGSMHPERPERLKAIDQMLEESGLIQKTLFLEPRAATLQEIEFIHTSQMIQEIAKTQHQSQTYLDGDTPASSHSYEAAMLAAGGLLIAIDALFEGKVDQAFAFPRPPGHHAEKDHAMGFCLFNNVAIAAEYALRKKLAKKIVIFDFDVHHGNGTQHSFYDRSDVFYISTHQYPFYPGTGASTEMGIGEGEGYNLNLPMPSGSDDEDYAVVMKERVIPAILNYHPNLVLVSAGFDAHHLDPLAGMEMTKVGFKKIAQDLNDVRKQLGKIPFLYTLEGGYHLKGLAESVKEVLAVMLEI